MKKQTRISEKAYKATGFIGKYQKLISETVIPYQYSVLSPQLGDFNKELGAYTVTAARKKS